MTPRWRVQRPPPTNGASAGGGDRLDLDRMDAVAHAMGPGHLDAAFGERLEARVLRITGFGADGHIDVAVGEDRERDAGLGTRRGTGLVTCARGAHGHETVHVDDLTGERHVCRGR